MECTEVMIEKTEQFFKDMIALVRTFSKKHKQVDQTADYLNESNNKIQSQNSEKNKKPSFNAYLLYFKENHKIIAQNNPNLSHNEITALAGASWKCLPKEEKEQYIARCQENKNKSQEKSEKPSFNAYLLYFKENHKIIAQNNPNLSHNEITALAGATWKSLSKNEQEKYITRSQEKKNKYLAKLKCEEEVPNEINTQIVETCLSKENQDQGNRCGINFQGNIDDNKCLSPNLNKKIKKSSKTQISASRKRPQANYYQFLNEGKAQNQ